MIPLGKLRALALVATASVGLLGGHSLTYLRLAPSAATRAGLLESSGHGYLDKAVVLAAAIALMSVLFWLGDGALKTRFARPSLAGMALVLGLVQVLGFTGQEVLERLLAGAALSDLGTVLLVGLPLQLVVAGLGTLLIAALRKAGEAIAELFCASGTPQAASTLLRIFSPVRFNSRLLAGGLRSRGPPLLLN